MEQDQLTTSNGEQEAEKTRRKAVSRERRGRLRNMIFPIRKSIPEHFSRLGDSEAVAEGFRVNRTDVLDRAVHSLFRRVERLEAQQIMRGAESPDKKEPSRERAILRVVASGGSAA